MQTLVTMAPSCICGMLMPICRIFSSCSGGIFGLFFMASDLMVISHKPGFICPAAHTAADPESIRNTSMDKAARRMRTPDDG